MPSSLRLGKNLGAYIMSSLHVSHFIIAKDGLNYSSSPKKTFLNSISKNHYDPQIRHAYECQLKVSGFLPAIYLYPTKEKIHL